MRIALIILSLQLILASNLTAQVEAIFNENRVEITWSYSDCTNIKFYVIEKSKNGNSFREMLKIKNGTNSPNNFLEIDHNPYENTSFYRIRYITTNNTYFYSETIAVKKPKQQELNKKLVKYDALNVLVVLKNKSNIEYFAKLNIKEDHGILKSETLNELLQNGEYAIIASENDLLVGNKLLITNRNINDLNAADTLNTIFR